MRKEFSEWLESSLDHYPQLLFLTGDLGYLAFEKARTLLKNRFINVGVCEQTMINVSAALAYEGLSPICYSISPFLLFRPFEQIRINIAIHNLNVNLVGNGGGYGYGIMGATHHALQDIAAVTSLPNFQALVPICNSDVPLAATHMMESPKPCYLRLGWGIWNQAEPLPEFAPVRRLTRPIAPKLTVVGMGPVLLQLLPIAEEFQLDCFAVSVMPLHAPPQEIIASLQTTNLLWVIEEHVERGGLAEHLALLLSVAGISFRTHHSHAVGYTDTNYGSQAFHLKESGLDHDTLKRKAGELSHLKP